MKHLLLKIEPLIWLLFGQGILLGTILLTGWILVVNLGVPLGLISDDGLAFQRAHELGSSLVGRLVLAALCALPLWKGAHHMRHVSIDSGGAGRDAVVAPLLYGVAALGSLLAIAAVIRL
ncbi:MAG: fumarate reductase subunit D [Deltaproteobacteria bacterium]|nr:fumarate reductase subunit D [Deltaproteobacteria bacterium]MBW2362892.1 fumarate reductase subunit D [Deltaproteobacteria bacterium]